MEAHFINALIGIFIGTSVGLIVFAANKFYSGVQLLVTHEEKIHVLTKAVTKDIPEKIDNLNSDVAKTHDEILNVFTSEFNPLNEKVGKIELDIVHLKHHTKYHDK